MLPEIQVFNVVRIEDNTFIGVMYTMKAAIALAVEYEDAWYEECRIGRGWIAGEETVAQRIANEVAR